MTKTETPIRWVHFSTANHPDTWDTQECGIITFADSFEAKKAEALFSRLERERAELIEALEDAIATYRPAERHFGKGRRRPEPISAPAWVTNARALLAKLKESS